jgi:hypothetical protein
VIVTGAVYGLIASGQSSFVTEPQRAERQQSIRVAMDLIARDIASAGVGMPGFVQTFTPGLNNRVCGDGPADNDSLDDCMASTTIAGQNTDELEVIGNPDGWEFERTCNYPGANSTVANMYAAATRIQVGQYVLVFMQNGTWTLRYVTGLQNNSSGAQGCDPVDKVLLQFAAGPDPNTPKVNMPGGLCANGSVGTTDDDPGNPCIVASVGLGDIISYRIRRDPWDGMPVLERRSTAGATGNPLNEAAYQVIARGIEDMQVQYAVADADNLTPIPEEAWVDDAPVVASWGGATPTAVEYASLTAKVRVTLTARNDAIDRGARTMDMRGATLDVNGNAGVRSSLTSTVVIRSTLNLIGQDRNQWAMWQ